MKEANPPTIRLAEYRPPDFLIDETDLYVDLHDDYAEVRCRLAVRRNEAAGRPDAPLRLDGQELELLSVELDGVALEPERWQRGGDFLLIPDVPDRFELVTVTRNRPQDNTSLEGLYRSRRMYCTQCEAEGFRKITYYLDRPDVLSRFTTTIEAEVARFPVLLSNGNPVAEAELEGGRHRITWADPFPKPCYLFALVAGDLVSLDDEFVTASGRRVALRIFVEHKDLDKCDHAMLSLKRAMAWDEQTYGREYDLDIFMIVAVDDFNMGAMENKGLNIFNTSCVLASADLTTDAAFQRVEGVVAHEYFHNWSGNRVTCRDWFQLSLKEGFTVFRDAEFSADVGSRTVKRVEDVSLLRTRQFAEDSGPMAHPVRPDSYIEIANFYTLTVYEKGAEVVRMLHTLLGPEQFRRGCDLYFERHDGDAVTCDDFVRAMEEASERDLTQFRRWYSQAGTPRLVVAGDYDAADGHFRLTVCQSTPPTPGQPHKQPLHVPLRVALFGTDGPLALRFEGDSGDAAPTERVLELTETEQTFTFTDLAARPVPSLLRGFSAPVVLEYDHSRAELAFLMRVDTDGFSRWDACQQLSVDILREMVAAYNGSEPMTVDRLLIGAFEDLLADIDLDPAMVALMLRLPSEAYLAELDTPIDVDGIHAARNAARSEIAAALREPMEQACERLAVDEPYHPEAAQIARRSLRNELLAYLAVGSDDGVERAAAQFDRGDNMTDVLAALTSLVNAPGDCADALARSALERFYERWRDEPLAVNQWLQVQATCALPGGLARVEALRAHEAFDIRNPNKVRSLIGAFAQANPVNFHAADASGYAFLVDRVLELDRLNPQVAARMLAPMTAWRKYPHARATKMREQLVRILAAAELSRDVYEVASKSLADADTVQ